MSNTPPPIPGLPPIIPSPSRPATPKQKVRFPLATKLILAAVAVFVAFMAFRLVQFGLYLRQNPLPQHPGEAAFREANRKIIANRGTMAFGNTPEAITLARDYLRSLKILREGFFSEGKKNAYSVSKGEFLTFCQWNSNSCVFLVHVPELRRFTREAKESLTELAWINAQSVLNAGTTQPPSTVAVGVKGAMLYEAIWIGDFVPDSQGEVGGVKTRGSGIQGTKLLFPFFAAENEAAFKNPETNTPEN
jgi:hypothetical protein